MKFRHSSLLYPVVGFLLLLTVSTLGVGYLINYSVLRDVLQERVRVKAALVTERVQQQVSAKIQAFVGFRRAWQESLVVRPAGEGAAPSESSGEEANWERLRGYMPYWKLDVLLAVDESGQVRRRLPDTLAVHDFSADLLARLNKNPEQMTVARIGGREAILAFSPAPDRAGGVVLGFFLEGVLEEIVGQNQAMNFALATPHGMIRTDGVVSAAARVDEERIVQVVERMESDMDFDPARTWNLFYTPFRILDRVLCLILPINLESTREILSGSTARLYWSGVYILVLLAVSGFVLNRRFLKPLRTLQGKAQSLVAVCTRESPHARHAVGGDGNEIDMLEHALKTATSKLYIHLDDLRERRELLTEMALQDRLTELLNHRMFVELLGRELKEAKRKNRPVAVLRMDLEGFEEVAAEFDPESRNQLLLEIVNRLRQAFRGEDLLFRLHHTQFAAFLPECGDPENARMIAGRIADSICQPITIKGIRTRVGMWIGVSLFPLHGEEMELLVQRAEVAMNHAMDQPGQCGYALFEEGQGVPAPDDADEEE